jgi:hypothetical protein
MMLARSIKDLAMADKTAAESMIRGKEAAKKEISEKLEKLEASSQTTGQLDQETLRKVREQIYGII